MLGKGAILCGLVHQSFHFSSGPVPLCHEVGLVSSMIQQQAAVLYFIHDSFTMAKVNKRSLVLWRVAIG
jgi:hypothetical protein